MKSYDVHFFLILKSNFHILYGVNNQKLFCIFSKLFKPLVSREFRNVFLRNVLKNWENGKWQFFFIQFCSLYTYKWKECDGILLPDKNLKHIPEEKLKICGCAGKCDNAKCNCKKSSQTCMIYYHKKGSKFPLRKQITCSN